MTNGNVNSIYTPKIGERMKVMFFYSGGASSMKAALEGEDNKNLYEVVGAATNQPQEVAPNGWDVAIQHGIPIVHLNPKEFKTREDFYAGLKEEVDDINPDIIGLSGWLKEYSIISDPLLSAYTIVNVHPARLSVIVPFENKNAWDHGRAYVHETRMHIDGLDSEKAAAMYSIGDSWHRLYAGDDAVTMAMLFGEQRTCSTIHLVEKKVDEGKILVQSEPEELDPGFVERMLNRNNVERIVKRAKKVQDGMKERCDVPAYTEFLRLAARGYLGTRGNTVFLNDNPLPYGGFQLSDEFV